MDLSDAIQRVVGNPGEMPELHQTVVDSLGGDSQKIGLALGALRMADEAIRVIKALGMELELRQRIKEEVEVEPDKNVRITSRNFDQPIGKRHK